MAQTDPLATRFGRRVVATDERRRLVRDTFAAVAPRYDLMNDLMSFGIHRLWKRRFAALCVARPDEAIVDLAGGTGDIALLLARGGARPIVVDPSPEMMRAGRPRTGATGLRWVAAEAERLPFADASVDLATISFGIRNVTELGVALREIARVLKPGGRFACLEFSRAHWLIRPGYDLWSRTAIPLLGAAVAGRIEAYRYLIESIRAFPDQEAFAQALREAGLADVRYRNFSFGIAAAHFARKPD